MDLSAYTPIYVRTDGDDGNDGLSVGNAKETVQAAYDTALAHGGGTGNKVLDLGAGTFAGVIITEEWPVRIAVRGAGVASSFLGGITGNGADSTLSGEPDYTPIRPTAGPNITIVSDNTCDLGAISSTGGGDADGYGYVQYEVSGEVGGNITLTDATAGAISTVGGIGNADIEAYGGAGGDVTLTNSTVASIHTQGGDGLGGAGAVGGDITLTNSVSGAISTTGGAGDYHKGGHGGNVTLTDSVSGQITSTGGICSYGPHGSGSGGNISLTNSTSGDINTAAGWGGRDSSNWDGAKGGNVTLLDSTSGTIYSLGGGTDLSHPSTLAPGRGGDISLTNSTNGNITPRGGVVYLPSGLDTVEVNAFPGTITVNGHHRFRPSTAYYGTVNLSSTWIAPDILGAGLL